MLSIVNYSRNANENYNDVSTHSDDLMAMIKKSTINAGESGEKGTLLHCWWERELVKPLWRTVWKILKKLKIELPYDPTIPLLGVYLDKL